jgi:hypothetical protein
VFVEPGQDDALHMFAALFHNVPPSKKSQKLSLKNSGGNVRNKPRKSTPLWRSPKKYVVPNLVHGNRVHSNKKPPRRKALSVNELDCWLSVRSQLLRCPVHIGFLDKDCRLEYS